MGRSKRNPSDRINPKSIDPDTGELYDAGKRPTSKKKSGVLDALKRAARDAAMRRVSTKR
jgi:hypothetical protein